MSITMEYLDSLEFEVVKQKYYNANKVNAKLEELKTGVAELIAENEALKQSSSSNAELEDKLAELMRENAGLMAENAKLTEEAEKLSNGLSEEDRALLITAGNELIAAAEDTANAVVAEAEVRSQRIVGAAQAEAKRILDEARNAPAAVPAGKLTAAQLDLIDELISQLDSLKSAQDIQYLKIKQKLMGIAID